MKFLDHLEEWLIASLMAAATLIVFVAVMHRYFSGYNIPVVQDWLIDQNLSWAQELTIIMFVWMAKFGAAYGVRTGIHVGVDVLIKQLSEGLRRRFILFGLLAGAAFTATVMLLGAKLVWDGGMHYFTFSSLGIPTDALSGGNTNDLDWPKWAVYLAVPLGSALMSFRFLQVALSFHRTGELPHHDHGHVDGIDESPAAEARQ